MKFSAVVFIIGQVAILQTYAQVLRAGPILPNILPGPLLPSPCGCGPNIIAAPPAVIAPPPAVIANPNLLAPSVIVQPNSVANNLADTLSLLTVSSLLAESLPLNYPNVVSVPSAYSPCGCGGLGGLSYYI